MNINIHSRDRRIYIYIYINEGAISCGDKEESKKINDHWIIAVNNIK